MGRNHQRCAIAHQRLPANLQCAVPIDLNAAVTGVPFTTVWQGYRQPAVLRKCNVETASGVGNRSHGVVVIRRRFRYQRASFQGLPLNRHSAKRGQLSTKARRGAVSHIVRRHGLAVERRVGSTQCGIYCAIHPPPLSQVNQRLE